ncbi:MerR family transcriptional regulator [Xanthovirga aplysinae]|uniref:MerR family transcriptional regulator n=1 Tax=Xanthovirga aplysinae TaxID=2529853 RepID=UPI0012BD1C16|nr:MerR family transcriptional regulator [Xanthovirga aplysinae]MTI30746.1 MerR family transcriptional regulator [Xanthovirga aplysinae]
MGNYSMVQVESLTGIKAHTLRVWERRYNFLRPMRTKTNIRYYSDEQLRKLLNISILIKNGFRISKLSKMPDEEIHERVNEVLKNPLVEHIEEEVRALSLSMLELNEAAFNHIYQTHVLRKGLFATVTQLIYPFLDHVGVLWTTSKTVPAQEHFISSLIRQKIIAAIETLPIPVHEAPSILLFLLEKEDHEIGLLLANFIAKDLGWKVYNLGPKVPVENIKTVVEIAKPQLMLTMFTTSWVGQIEELLNIIRKEVNIPLLVSGNPELLKETSLPDEITLLKKPDDLISFLSRSKKD